MLFVTCTPGLESALADELKELGFKGESVRGGFRTQGDAAAIAKKSRIASSIKNGPRELYTDLYRRGYRQEIGRAPMRETLAAGMLRLAGYIGDEALLDPMCGSGTLLIEAALIANAIPPGDLKAGPSRPATALLMGTDLNSGALGVTRRNARRAGVTLKLERADAAKLVPPAPSGLLVANLPYGKRVEKGELDVVIEHFCQAFTGWRFALLTQSAWPKLPVTSEHSLSNGGLWCRLLLGRF